MKTRKLLGAIVCISSLNSPFGLAMKKTEIAIRKKYPKLYQKVFKLAKESVSQFKNQNTFEDLGQLKEETKNKITPLLRSSLTALIKEEKMTVQEAEKDVELFSEIINEIIQLPYAKQFGKLKLELEQGKLLLEELQRQEALSKTLPQKAKKSFALASNREDLIARFNSFINLLSVKALRHDVHEKIWPDFLLWFGILPEE